MDVFDPAKLEALVHLAEEAGKIVMVSDRTAMKKGDGSDVTPADLNSDAILVAGIRRLMGQEAQILSEEGGPISFDARKGVVFVIDPLDGTTKFTRGSRHFSILLAVLMDGEPVFGVAVAPAYGLTACGGPLMRRVELRLHGREEKAPYRLIRQLPALAAGADQVIVPKEFFDARDRLAMQSVMAEFQARAGAARFVKSSYVLGTMMPVFKRSVRYGLYKAGAPDQRAGDWDLAAWDAMLRGMGGLMTSLEGARIVYGDAANGFKHENFVCWRKAADAAAYAIAPFVRRKSQETRIFKS